MSTRTSCHFSNLLQVLKKISFFMILYMYRAPGQGQTAHRGQSFDVNRNVWSLHSCVASLKKNVFEVYNLIHVYSPRAGADNPQGTKF